MSSDHTDLDLDVSGVIGALYLDIKLKIDLKTLVLIGPNGAGKSSLLAMLLGVREVTRGRVVLGGEVLCDVAAEASVPVESRRLGYLPQDYALFPHLTVHDNVAFARKSRMPQEARAMREAHVAGLLAELGLGALSDRRPATLSGGEKQRVALARALAAAPRALLLDEPLAALDVHARSEVRAFLGAYLKKLGLPTIIVTHDAAEARQLGDQIAVLEAGRVTQVGSWEELARDPRTPFIAAFVASAGESGSM